LVFSLKRPMMGASVIPFRRNSGLVFSLKRPMMGASVIPFRRNSGFGV